MTQNLAPDWTYQFENTSSQLNIGLVTGSLYEDSIAILRGAISAAEERHVNLICFQGGQIKPQFDPESIYRLINPDYIDGLILWTGWLGQYASPQETARFCDMFAPIKMISISQQLERAPSVMIDNRQGVREIVNHLIHVHQRQKIAFVQGPTAHFESEERYEVYLETLQVNNIKPDLHLTVPGFFTKESGVDAVTQLLDERKQLPDAIVTLDDYVAIGVITELQRRGLRVPEDIAVTGFDNVPVAEVFTPPLTTVHQSGFDMGRRAMHLLVDALAGNDVPLQTNISTPLIIRSSCGCPDPTFGNTTEYAPTENGMASGWDAIAASITASLKAQFPEYTFDWLPEFLCFFQYERDNEADHDFRSAFEKILTDDLNNGVGLSSWPQIITIMAACMLAELSQPARQEAEYLLEQARLFVIERQRRREGSKRIDNERSAFVLHRLGQKLITTFDLGVLAELVQTRLPELGIPAAAIVLYEDPASTVSGKEGKPQKQFFTLASYQENHAYAQPEIVATHSFPIPEPLFIKDKANTLIVEPLDFQEEHLGYAIFEMGPSDGILYEKLRGYLSSAIKGALLFQRSEYLFQQEMVARERAEKADKLKTTLLANVSHDLRTPLNVILGYVQSALNTPNPYGQELPPDLLEDLKYVSTNAEHLTRLINDLLDLSRAEIDELTLYPEPLDTRAFLVDVFDPMVRKRTHTQVNWQLDLPTRMPVIMADPDRLRQILLNLLSNADKFTEHGAITLGATIEPPFLHLWIQDTGSGIPIPLQERIFEPFITSPTLTSRRTGIGLGLSITRRLVALHKGIISLESKLEEGSTFHVYLPLPSLYGEAILQPPGGSPVLLFVSAAKQVPDAITELCQRGEWGLLPIENYDELPRQLTGLAPVAISWDVSNVRPNDWLIIQKLRADPHLSQLPFLIFDMPQSWSKQGDLTSVFMKPLHSEKLINFIEVLGIAEAEGYILIVDDDPQAREMYQSLILGILPDCAVKTAVDGLEALNLVKDGLPSLIILDLMMPKVDGFGVIRQLRANPETEAIPIIVLSGKILTPQDIQQLKGERVFLQTKGVLSEEELSEVIAKVIGEGGDLRPSNEIVKTALGFIHQHYPEPISRTEIAQATGVDKDYLGRLFRQELGMTVGDYINRFRIYQAKQMLHQTDMDITHIAYQCGFHDPAYFSRLFRKLTGTTPRKFRKQK